MKLPRLSIGLMAYLVLIATLDLAWIIGIFKEMVILRRSSVFGLGWNTLDAPVIGLANVLAVSGYPLLVRRSGRPFPVGFVVGGLLCSAVFVVHLRTHFNLCLDLDLWQRPIEKWFGLSVHRPGESRFVARFLVYLALMSAAGALPLLALAALAGLLTRLVARGKPIPRPVTVAMVAIVLWSTAMMLRRNEFQELATRDEETGATLSSEADAISKELEKARSAGSPPGDRAGAEVTTMETELGLRRAAHAKVRRQMEKYRRAASRPWFPVEE